jgi:hypothetical protein
LRNTLNYGLKKQPKLNKANFEKQSLQASLHKADYKQGNNILILGFSQRGSLRK